MSRSLLVAIAATMSFLFADEARAQQNCPGGKCPTTAPKAQEPPTPRKPWFAVIQHGDDIKVVSEAKLGELLRAKAAGTSRKELRIMRQNIATKSLADTELEKILKQKRQAKRRADDQVRRDLGKVKTRAKG